MRKRCFFIGFAAIFLANLAFNYFVDTPWEFFHHRETVWVVQSFASALLGGIAALCGFFKCREVLFFGVYSGALISNVFAGWMNKMDVENPIISTVGHTTYAFNLADVGMTVAPLLILVMLISRHIKFADWW